MSTQHTPGPWKAVRNASFWEVVTPSPGQTLDQADQYSPSIAYVWGQGEEQAEANSRLIAAAPTILQELIRAREYIAACIQSHAETVTNSTTGLVDDPNDVLALEADQDLLNGIDAAIAHAKGEA